MKRNNISEEEGYLKCEYERVVRFDREMEMLCGKKNQNGRDKINIGFIVGTNRFFSRT